MPLCLVNQSLSSLPTEEPSTGITLPVSTNTLPAVFIVFK